MRYPSSDLFMSSLSRSDTFMASAMVRKGISSREWFHKFFECWLVEQNQYLRDLIAASSRTDLDGRDQLVLQPLLDRVIMHYEHYYQAKSRCAKEDVLAVLSPAWRSSLEDAFLWIGGWRPSMAFHLLYSKSGIQVESQLAELIRGLSTGDLADLSPDQLRQVDALQKSTVREEREISEKMAKHQETVADTSMVELSHVVTEILQNGDVTGESRSGIDRQVDETLHSKEEGLEEILMKADELRLNTLKKINDILSPIQNVHFLIAAAELHLRIHEWGKKRDAAANQRALSGGGTNAPSLSHG